MSSRWCRPAEMQFFGRRNGSTQLMKIYRSPPGSWIISFFCINQSRFEVRPPAAAG